MPLGCHPTSCEGRADVPSGPRFDDAGEPLEHDLDFVEVLGCGRELRHHPISRLAAPESALDLRVTEHFLLVRKLKGSTEPAGLLRKVTACLALEIRNERELLVWSLDRIRLTLQYLTLGRLLQPEARPVALDGDDWSKRFDGCESRVVPGHAPGFPLPDVVGEVVELPVRIPDGLRDDGLPSVARKLAPDLRLLLVEVPPPPIRIRRQHEEPAVDATGTLDRPVDALVVVRRKHEDHAPSLREIVQLREHPRCEQLEEVALRAIQLAVAIEQELVDLVEQDDEVVLLFEHLEDRLRTGFYRLAAEGDEVARRDRDHPEAEGARELPRNRGLPGSRRSVQEHREGWISRSSRRARANEVVVDLPIHLVHALAREARERLALPPLVPAFEALLFRRQLTFGDEEASEFTRCLGDVLLEQRGIVLQEDQDLR